MSDSLAKAVCVTAVLCWFWPSELGYLTGECKRNAVDTELEVSG